MMSWLWGGQPEPPEFRSAKGLFDKATVDQLDRVFKQATSGSPDDVHAIQRLCNLGRTQELAQRLVRAVLGGSSESTLTFPAYVIAKARCEKQGEEAAREFTFSLIQDGPSGTASAASLQEVLVACAVLLGVAEDAAAARAEGWAAAVAAGALRQMQASSSSMTHNGAGGDSGAGGRGMDQEGYRKWSLLLPALHEVLRRVFEVPEPGTAPSGTDSTTSPGPTSSHRSAPPQGGSPGAAPASAAAGAAAGAATDPRWSRLVPHLVVPPQYGAVQLLLQPHGSWLLASRMPPDERMEWRLLFSSLRDGGSFNTFMARVKDCSPVLLLIRDSGGHLFGGYAPQPWAKRGAFYGEFATFIFGLLPEVVIYPATGINSNFQWCGVHFSELPNGVGFGGQPGHFALFVDSSFEAGISRPAATFANAPLSKEQTFKVEDVECWMLKPLEEEQEGGGGGSSILDAAKEDQKILQLGGVNVDNSAALGIRRHDNTPIED